MIFSALPGYIYTSLLVSYQNVIVVCLSQFSKKDLLLLTPAILSEKKKRKNSKKTSSFLQHGFNNANKTIAKKVVANVATHFIPPIKKIG